MKLAQIISLCLTLALPCACVSTQGDDDAADSNLSAITAIQLSPIQNGGSGHIPGTYSAVVFSLSDGNWVPELDLAATAPDGATVTIQSSAAYPSSLNTSNTDYPLPSLAILAGDNVTFTYQASSNQWKISAATYTPNDVGAQIPPLPSVKMARYMMYDGNWTPSVTLPATALNNTVVVISSDATYGSQVSAQNTLYPSTFLINAGDTYAFLYRGDLQRWVPATTPTRGFGAAQVGQFISTPTAPRTEVVFANGDWIPQISLPSTAGNRDRIVIRSTADLAATILNDYVDFTGTLQLSKGDRYEFMFISEKSKWVLHSSTTVTLNVSQLGGGQMPGTRTPVTELIVGDANWAPVVQLPNVAKPGDRVIVRSTAAYDLDMTAAAADFTSVRIHQNEQVRFLRTPENRWTRETRIITMLLVYSEEAAARLGEGAEQARMLEGLRLTNEALENSRVNFYVKPVGFIKRQVPGAGGLLTSVLDVGRSDPVIQTARKDLAADTVFYEGTEDGGGACGWGQVDPINPYNMFAVGSVYCLTTVMRHEFGHNMGLGHAGTPGYTPYAQGYSAPGVATIMGGNVMGFYSSPRLYTPDLGIPMGIENQVDAVRNLNERSETVSNFY